MDTSGKRIHREDIKKLADKLHSEREKIVLVGGCFDILHIGHFDFLERAKKLGDILIVLLESDETLTKLKGVNRPIHKQEDRARMLASIEVVDYVVFLPPMDGNKAYDDVIFEIKPAIIATTIGDAYRLHKLRQANSIKAEIVDIAKVANHSTSKVAKLLEKEI